MDCEKLVPDVDDYDDDNSLASLFLSLFVRRLAGRDPRRGKQAALSHVRNVAKKLRKKCAI